MKLLVAIAPDRYRDEELDNPLAVFRKAGIGFDIAGIPLSFTIPVDTFVVLFKKLVEKIRKMKKK